MTPSKMFYVPGKPGAVDGAIEVDGIMRGLYSGETIEELATRYPGVRLGDYETIQAESEALMKRPPSPITAEKFNDALNVLPPENWTRAGNTESFKLSEYTWGPITAIYARIGDKHYSMSDRFDLSHATIILMCREADMGLHSTNKEPQQ